MHHVSPSLLILTGLACLGSSLMFSIYSFSICPLGASSVWLIRLLRWFCNESPLPHTLPRRARCIFPGGVKLTLFSSTSTDQLKCSCHCKDRMAVKRRGKGGKAGKKRNVRKEKGHRLKTRSSEDGIRLESHTTALGLSPSLLLLLFLRQLFPECPRMSRGLLGRQVGDGDR